MERRQQQQQQQRQQQQQSKVTRGLLDFFRITFFNILAPISLYVLTKHIRQPGDIDHDLANACNNEFALKNAFSETFYASRQYVDLPFNKLYLFLLITLIVCVFLYWLLCNVGSFFFDTVQNVPLPRYAIHLILVFYGFIYLARLMYYTGYYYYNNAHPLKKLSTSKQYDINEKVNPDLMLNIEEQKKLYTTTIDKAYTNLIKSGRSEHDATLAANSATLALPPIKPPPTWTTCNKHPEFIQKIIDWQGIDIYSVVLWTVMPFTLVQTAQQSKLYDENNKLVQKTTKGLVYWSLWTSALIAIATLLVAWAFFKEQNMYMVTSFILLPFLLAPIYAQVINNWTNNKLAELFFEMQNVSIISLVIVCYTLYCFDAWLTIPLIKIRIPMAYIFVIIAIILWIASEEYGKSVQNSKNGQNGRCKKK